MVGNSVRALVLAAGKSSRFKTEKSKQLFALCGRPMLLYPLQALQQLSIPTTIVVGHKAQEVQEMVEKAGLKKISFVIQKELLGTGDAVMRTKEFWDRDTLLVMNGDSPLITSQVLEKFYHEHTTKEAAVSFIASHAVDPQGYGRVIQKESVYSIVEHKECTPEQLAITFFNAGFYLFSKEFLVNVIDSLEKHGTTGEFYLPDLIHKASLAGLKVNAFTTPFDVVRGVNTLQEFAEVEHIKRQHLISFWMSQGVYFQMPHTVHLDYDITLGKGTEIGAGVQILAGTVVGKNCLIEPYSVLSNAEIGDDCRIYSHTSIYNSSVSGSAKIGPFARLRDKVTLNKNVSIGNFVEVKNSRIDKGTKAKHLAFLGDASIGQAVNIGAGTITCNWDGIKKHQTIIEDNAHIGANSSLIAPLRIGIGAHTAAGSTITQDIMPGDLAIGRARQVNKAGYAKKIKERNVKRAEENKNERLTHGAVVAEEDVLVIKFEEILKEKT